MCQNKVKIIREYIDIERSIRINHALAIYNHSGEIYENQPQRYIIIADKFMRLNLKDRWLKFKIISLIDRYREKYW